MSNSQALTNAPARTADVEAVALAIGVSVKTVRRDISRGAPHDRSGRKLLLDIEEYRAWRDVHNLTGERGRPKLSDEDLLYERIIAERTKNEARMRRNEIDAGELVTAEDLLDLFLQPQAQRLRALVEDLERKGMTEAADMVRETVNEVLADTEHQIAALGRTLQAGEGVGAGGNPAATADDEAVCGAGDHPADRPV